MENPRKFSSNFSIDSILSSSQPQSRRTKSQTHNHPMVNAQSLMLKEIEKYEIPDIAKSISFQSLPNQNTSSSKLEMTGASLESGFCASFTDLPLNQKKRKNPELDLSEISAKFQGQVNGQMTRPSSGRVSGQISPILPNETVNDQEIVNLDEARLDIDGVSKKIRHHSAQSLNETNYSDISQHSLNYFMNNESFNSCQGQSHVHTQSCSNTQSLAQSKTQAHTQSNQALSPPFSNFNSQIQHTTPRYANEVFSNNFCLATSSTGVPFPLRKENGKTVYECPECGKRLSQLSNLKAHLRVHTGERPFECNVCKRKFSQLAHLNKHKQTHTGERPYHCRYCDKTFATGGNLKSHMQTQHKDDRIYRCKDCSQCFATIAELRPHVCPNSITGRKQFEQNLQGLTNNFMNNPATMNFTNLNLHNLNLPNLTAGLTGQNLNPNNSNGQHLNASNLNTPNMNGQNLNARNSNGQNLNAQKINAQTLNGQTLNGQNLNSQNLNAQKEYKFMKSQSPISQNPNSQKFNVQNLNSQQLGPQSLQKLQNLQNHENFNSVGASSSTNNSTISQQFCQYQQILASAGYSYSKQ